ncbi:hypothetical protein ACHAXR_007972 [Thalassiosira sp. AJA248-18]
MSDEAWVDFVAGWVSGGVSVLACQPIDTVLTRMQANAGIQTARPDKISSRPGAMTVNIFRGMVSNFGFTSLWRGSSAMIGAVPVQNALLMSGYGAGKRWSTSSNDSSSSNNVLMGVFIGGCAGGVLQSFIMSPVELVKVTQQVVGESVTSATTTVCRGIFSPTGAWKGLGATLLRDGLPHGVWFASYEYCKTKLTELSTNNEKKTSSKDDVAIPMLSGAFAATTAWAVGYPADLIKTRIQAGSGKGIFGTAKDLVNESNGRVVHGLYRGFSLKLFRAIPASAIGFLTYETAAKFLTSK